MSETRTAGEIEDILSSIRRLVSEDLRPTPRPQIVSRMVVEDRLILTPALRVVSSRPARAEAPVAAPAPEPVAETAAEPVAASAAPEAAPEIDAPLPRLHLGAAHQAEPSRATVVDALTQAVDQQAMDWESETGDPGPDADSLDWSSFSFARRSGRDDWPAQAANIESPPPAPASPEPWAQPDPEASLAEDQPAVQEALAQEPVAQEPAVEQPAAATSRAWADSAEAEALADLAPEEESVTPAQDQVDDIFSEDVLRELVRDLIREQLQGDLGERITRNIRKLVKAEIARALAVQSLE